MIKELSDEAFTRIVENIIENLGYNTSLSNPDTEAEYPCVTVGNTLSNILITDENNIPIKTHFQINVEVWDTKKYDTMKIMNEVIIEFRKYNLIKVGNTTEIYDEITRKHRRGEAFEVFFNGLTGSFDRTK